MDRETLFIGFGSNLGDRMDFCDRAITLLGLLPGCQVAGLSSLYETEPVADAGEPGAGWFVNGVVQLQTELPPRTLLAACREIERALGRNPEHRPGPRTLDLDLLFYGACIINELGLIVPHPRLHHRRFVLAPMAELDPTWRHPVLHQTVRELLDQLGDSSVVRRLESQPGSRYGTRPSCRTSTRFSA